MSDSNKQPKRTTFTAYVRTLGEGREASPQELDEVWDRLRQVTSRALKYRGMWTHPPAFLGFSGHGSWALANRPAGIPKEITYDALDELTQEVFIELFGSRRESLIRYVLEDGREIEALVGRSAKQTIHSLQKKHDPIGTLHFDWLRSAVDAGAQEGYIKLDNTESNHSGRQKIVGATVLYFTKSDTSAVKRAEQNFDSHDLEPVVREWNDELFLSLATGKGKEFRNAVDQLEQFLVELGDLGIQAVSFGALLKAWKRDTRRRLSYLFEDLVPKGFGIPGQEHESGPEPSLRLALGCWREEQASTEASGRFQTLSGCVEQRIAERREQKRRKRDLQRLWRLLGQWAHPQLDGPGSEASDKRLDPVKFPSNRKIASILGTHHERIPGLLSSLREDIAICFRNIGRSVSSTDTVGTDPSSPAPGLTRHDGESNVESSKDFTEKLLAATEKAVPKSASQVTSSDNPLAKRFFLGSAEGPEIEWFVLDRRGGSALIVPVDSEPWQGTRDEALSLELNARLGLGVWLPENRLPEAESRLEPDDERRRLLYAYQSLLSGDEPDVEDPRWETDAEPEYRSWILQLDQRRSTLCEDLGGSLEAPAEELDQRRDDTEATSPKPQILDFRSHAGKKRSTTMAGRQRYQLAAMLLLTLGLGSITGTTYQRLQFADRLQVLETERLDLENRLAEDRKTFEEQLARLEAPEILRDSLFIPEGTPRGVQQIVSQKEDVSVLLEIEALNGDRVHLFQWPEEKTLLDLSVRDLGTSPVLVLRLPKTRIRLNEELRVHVERQGQLVTKFRFEVIEEKES